MLQAALDLQAAGLCVIPLGERSKRPAVAWKLYQTRRPCMIELRRWFVCPRNLAVVCGQVSGPQGLSLAVLDFDRPGFDGWAAEYPDVVENTWISATGRDKGRHVWLLVPGQVRSVTFDYGEVKAEGGYVVAPPSIHPNGKPYRWLRRQGEILVVEDPRALGLGMREHPTAQRNPMVSELSVKDGSPLGNGATPERLLDMALRRAVYGTRNSVGFWLAAQLRDNGYPMAWAQEIMLSYQAAMATLGDHAYTEVEALRTLESAYSTPPREPWRCVLGSSKGSGR